MTVIEKGQKALESDLTNQRGDHIKLSDYRGKYVLLSWHPLVFTPAYTDQMRDLKANYDFFADHSTEVLRTSVDPQPSKKVWAETLCLSNLNILSNFKPLREVSKTYGVWQGHSGTSERAVVLVGPDGTVLWSHKYEDSVKPNTEKIKEIVSQYKA